jgi:hypothetical protein
MLRVAAALAEPTAAAKKARIPAEKRMVSNLSKESEAVEKVDGLLD